MTFTDAAAEVLRLVGRPLHYKEITDFAIEKNLLSHVGKSPEVTMGARLAALMKKETPECPFVKVKPGVFALRAWDDATIKAGLRGAKGGAKAAPKKRSDDAEADEPGNEGEEVSASAESDDEPEPVTVPADTDDDDDDDDELLVAPKQTAPAVRAPEQAAAPKPRSPRFEDEDDEARAAVAPEDRLRAELVAGAREVFDEEDDDDQPILASGTDAGGEAGEGDGRRRRRRRRRGRGGSEGAVLPSYTATPVDGQQPPAPRAENVTREGGGQGGGQGGGRFEGNRDGRERDRDRDRDRDRGGDRGRDWQPRPPAVDMLSESAPAGDDLGGKDFAEWVAQLVGTFDRSAGPVSLRQIAEAAQRRNKFSGDVQVLSSMVAAAVRADNIRRVANGQRPRFRFAAGRVALTDWILGNELAQLEHEATQAVERYREAARRSFAKRASELPGHAFVELALLAIERVGVSQLRAVRRPGAGSGESHFSAAMKTASGEVRAGIVIRRDGREIGRERVTELRGSLHHYNAATVGWIITGGQVLSGAREEADIPGTGPVALTDGGAFARFCEEHDVGVVRTKLAIAIPDVDLFEALRAS